MSTDLVPLSGNNIVASIDELTLDIPSTRFATDLTNRVLGMQDMLKRIDQYNSVAREYAKAEALLYVRIVEQGKAGGLHGKKGEVCMWVAKMSEKERMALIERCASGVTITYVYKHEVCYKNTVSAIDKLHKNSDSLIKEYTRNGRVTLDIGRFTSGISPTKAMWRMVDAERDRAKDKLLKLDAVGVGKNTYIKAGSAGSQEALFLRVRSIYADITRLHKLLPLYNITDFEGYMFESFLAPATLSDFDGCDQAIIRGITRLVDQVGENK